MKKWFALLLTVLLVAGVVSASAQTVSCSAGFSLTLPDSFSKVSRSSADDPELELHYSNGSVDMAVYVSYAGSDNSFQVLTGSEEDSGRVRINGIRMNYARGSDSQGPWMVYSWVSSGNNVSIYFIWYGDDAAAMEVIDSIMNSVSAG
ncbi:MAG: hypothetical protein IJL36_07410 [Clostridia bacterium]|nr:hypothetical protein [Clostridia bacterium]